MGARCGATTAHPHRSREIDSPNVVTHVVASGTLPSVCVHGRLVPVEVRMAAHDAAVKLARDTLARELGCRAADVALIDVEAVEWSDSALGCS